LTPSILAERGRGKRGQKKKREDRSQGDQASSGNLYEYFDPKRRKKEKVTGRKIAEGDNPCNLSDNKYLDVASSWKRERENTIGKGKERSGNIHSPTTKA